MTWDTLFHKEQDAFRRMHGKLPKYLYAGEDARLLYKAVNNPKDEPLWYAGVPVVWVHRKTYFKFHL